MAPVDVKFRRSDKEGLSFQEVRELQKELNLLNRSLKAGETVTKKDFRKARIAAIVSSSTTPSDASDSRVFSRFSGAISQSSSVEI